MESTVNTNFFSSFLTSALMITASEIGDKTFFITAIMAVKNSRLTVFLGSMAGLTLNNVISIFLGVLTAKLNATLMHHISVALFLIFGVKMVYEGFKMADGGGLEEYNEAEKTVNENESVEKKGTFLGRLFGKRALLFLQVFSIIFFAEVGDKAQLSAIMLATRENIYGVGVGSFVGFFLSNAFAVLGSRAILTRIPVNRVITFGGFVFILCAFLKIYF